MRRILHLFLLLIKFSEILIYGTLRNQFVILNPLLILTFANFELKKLFF